MFIHGELVPKRADDGAMEASKVAGSGSGSVPMMPLCFQRVAVCVVPWRRGSRGGYIHEG